MKRLKIKLIKRLLVSFAVSFGILSCGSSSSAVEGVNNFEDLKSFAQNREFEIENRWANPMRANTVSFINHPNFNSGTINLIGNANFIRFKGDSINVFLPYFGVRQMSGGYNDRGAIKFEGVPEDFEIIENEDKKYVRYEFTANDDSEQYQFYVTLYPNGNTNTSVNSSQRDNISYTGKFSKLSSEEGE
ncbi:DUF4251 domain-containing protein [Zunongwangia endophytica]|uniref:DUF4251 domain-containing protein n=1 Tax=Zunongwangia endophytica TaxID=1808945 RepID=A0ABV8HHE8_9FLAO|nr:DUF4251 domain-containing protein [Zunongwangia endophytica]MDN3594054.1 DUF4251 domain-containing protein [Zunongwangia endophytica]